MSPAFAVPAALLVAAAVITTAEARTAAAPACRPATLNATATAGGRGGYLIRIENRGPGECTLTALSVELAPAAGRGAGAARAAPLPAAFTLATRGTARATVKLSGAARGRCYNATRLLVRSSGGSLSISLKPPAHVCATTSIGLNKFVISRGPPLPTVPTTPPATIPPVPTSGYPLHTNITATVFWVGEPKGGGSSADNALSAYDDLWQSHYGGCDDYTILRTAGNRYFPAFVPAENPFYLDLPYDDFTNAGRPRADRTTVVPWAAEDAAGLSSGKPFSLMKNRWVKIWRTVAGVTYTAYGQIEDAGPYVYDDAAYVFGSNDTRPRSKRAQNAGMDVSPALRDYLHFTGSSASDRLNNNTNTVNWQFVDAKQVPEGPWTAIVTTRQVYWP